MKPSKKRQAEMMNTARDLWKHHAKEAGNCVMPFVFAQGHSGEFLVYSEMGVPSREIAKMLFEKFGGSNPYTCPPAPQPDRDGGGR